MAIVTERLLFLIDAKTGGAVKEFDKLGKTAAKNDQQLTGVTGSLASFSSKLTGLSGSLGQALPFVAAGAAAFGVTASAVKDTISTFEDMAGQARKIQRATGETAEEASSLAAVMRVLGIDTDNGATALNQFAKKLDPEALRKYGVEVAHNADGTTDLHETLLRVADAYQHTADKSDQAKLGAAAFGKQFVTLQPLLLQGRKGLDDLFKQNRGSVLDAKQLEDARKLTRSIAQLKEEFGGLEAQIGSQLVPALVNVAKGLGVLADQALNAERGIGVLSDGLDRLAKKHPTLIGNTLRGIDVLTGLNLAGEKAGDGAKDAADGIDDLGDSSKTAEDALKSLESALKANISAQRAVEDAQDSIAASGRKITDLEGQRKKLLAAGAVDLKAVADAERGLRDAREGQQASLATLAGAEANLGRVRATALSDATEDLTRSELRYRGSLLDVADAQDAAADAQKRLDTLRSGPSSADQAEATLAVAEAQQRLADLQQQASRGGSTSTTANDVTRAQLDLLKAEQALADLQAGSPKRTQEIADAERDLERRKITLEGATLDQGDAERDLADKRDVGGIAAAKVRDAEAQVDAARRGVRDASEQVAAAEDTLRTARAGDPDFQKKLADLDQQIADARKNQARETADLSQKVYDAAKAQSEYATAVYASASATDALRKSIGSLPATGFEGPTGDLSQFAGGAIGHLAGGGSASAGTPYVIGERGREVFVPSTNGTVISTDALNRGGGSTTLVVPVSVDGKVIAQVVTTYQQKSARNGGTRG
jgi:hypothetical protein